MFLKIRDQDPRRVILCEVLQKILRHFEVVGVAEHFQHLAQVIRLHLVRRTLPSIYLLVGLDARRCSQFLHVLDRSSDQLLLGRNLRENLRFEDLAHELIFVLLSFFAILYLDWRLLLVGHSDVARKDDGLKELKSSVLLAMVVGDEAKIVSELQRLENFG